MSITGTSPTGKDLDPSMSMQFGLLGTYRLKKNMMGFAGYAYRSDSGSYQSTPFSEDTTSFASEGDSNTVQIQGHYLNLVLEYSF